MRKLYYVLKFGAFLFLALNICILGVYLFAYISPKIGLNTANHFTIFDKDDKAVFQGSGNSEWVNLEDISQYLIDAVISIEDKNFYSHQGFDYLRIADVALENITSGNIEGGASTISQQYVKNMFLTFDQTWVRKIEEAFLTIRLETHYSKDDILEGYLNTINYGNGNYGVQNASRYYFNKDAKDLSLEEAVILSGIPKNPTNYNPVTDYDTAVMRGQIVAEAMVRNKKITQSEVDTLFQNAVEIYGKKNKNNLQTLMYYQDAVINELKALGSIPNSLIQSGGLKIYTNLDLEAQTNMEMSLINNMEQSSLQVSSVMVDPKSGKIIALTGGYDYASSQYNRATKSFRQVGSTIKPFLYYAALENGFVSSSTFKSEPTTFTLSNDKTYSPKNFNEKYANGNITMQAAISYSDNIYAVKTHMFLGEETLVETAKRAGIKKEMQAVPSLALGTDELNILDFATGYTTLASGGYQRDLYLIRKVTDMNDNGIYEKKEKETLVFNPNYTYILNEMLTSPYNGAFLDYNTPTLLSAANSMTKKYATKTGSTNSDSWIVGYTPDILMLVWNGYDDGGELSANDGAVSKKIWLESIETYLKDKETSWYTAPENVIGIIQNPITGEFTTNSKKAAAFYYVKGSEPSSTASVSKEFEKDSN